MSDGWAVGAAGTIVATANGGASLSPRARAWEIAGEPVSTDRGPRPRGNGQVPGSDRDELRAVRDALALLWAASALLLLESDWCPHVDGSS